MNKLNFTVLVLSVAAVAACAKKEVPQVPASGQQSVQVQQAAVEDYIPDTGTYGTVTQCPVMGEKVVIGKDTKAVKYKGKAYYLCCPSCVGQFKVDPEKYAK